MVLKQSGTAEAKPFVSGIGMKGFVWELSFRKESWTMLDAIRREIQVVFDRDPAARSIVEIIFYTQVFMPSSTTALPTFFITGVCIFLPVWYHISAAF